MIAFEEAFEHVVKNEGGYSNDVFDSGGATNWGITEAVARANGYAGSMRDLSLTQAKGIYKRQYWDTLRLDEIAALSQPVARELFDTAVNMGIGVAGTFLQRCLTALNDGAKLYPDLAADGVVGPMTVSALRSYTVRRGGAGEVVLLRLLNGLQAARYLELAERREKDERFLFGWIANRVA